MIGEGKRRLQRPEALSGQSPGFFELGEKTREFPRAELGHIGLCEEEKVAVLAVKVHHDGKRRRFALDVEGRAVRDVDLLPTANVE